MDQVPNIAGTMRAWLAAQSDMGLAWLDEAATSLGAELGTDPAARASDRALFAAFASAPRQVGRDELPVLALDGGWSLTRWTRDQAARVLLLLARPQDRGFLPALDRLFQAADLAELVCLYQALPLLPYQDQHTARAAEGVRSNMPPVFKAIAIGNPYPAEWLDEGAWNQMVVKALFIGCPLHGIIGLDQRANTALARMLVDYARERRVAGRAVAPDLWRPVGPFAEGARTLHELGHALGNADPTQQLAAGLALAASPHPEAAALLDQRPDLAREVKANRLSWRVFAEQGQPLGVGT